MNDCRDCLHMTRSKDFNLETCTRPGVDRYTDGLGPRVQFERHMTGSCGPEGRFFVSIAGHSVESQTPRLA